MKNLLFISAVCLFTLTSCNKDSAYSYQIQNNSDYELKVRVTTLSSLIGSHTYLISSGNTSQIGVDLQYVDDEDRKNKGIYFDALSIVTIDDLPYMPDPLNYNNWEHNKLNKSEIQSTLQINNNDF